MNLQKPDGIHKIGDGYKINYIWISTYQFKQNVNK